jgi:hypothetical protein
VGAVLIENFVDLLLRFCVQPGRSMQGKMNSCGAASFGIHEATSISVVSMACDWL